MEYYTPKIQLDKKVIDDVFATLKEGDKLLVFGLGHDSKMWYEATHKNTFFVEDKDEYIRLTAKDVPADHIVKYTYKTTCAKTTALTDDAIRAFEIPEKLLQEAPFDVIIIDGPEGYSPEKPGRLIPSYWSTLLSKPGTIIYIDDAIRPVEQYCLKKYFADKVKKEFPERSKCMKLTI